MRFQDHFSRQASTYAQYRPSYPEDLFDWLACQASRRGLAWDVATGSGQSAVALAQRFTEVIATEPSAAQLANAARRPNINYRQEPAERASLADGSADLITVAQALHWFDLPAFLTEAARVLRPGGVLAVWCYELFSVDADIDAIVADYYHGTVGPYWPPERRWLEQGYAGLALPYASLATPAFTMALDWNLDMLLGYLASWSATQRYRDERQHDPLPEIRNRLAAAWGEPAHTRRINWPLTVQACRKPA
ncbi:class I SAM-dependent methyltransferase [Chitinimonas arctica]|uniref:Class I SAM-dependent methyltransferase n=1 Tax=Chitinimonas arctica TaxID=2594795 RepID=A0A516SK83_9NEIS|nr:class I SAM-dependent methyltransferase [Chitinimonas arctica]QDQ28428.1 class I SAM-dependent methyltransferase [Chitinimonas arctica]